VLGSRGELRTTHVTVHAEPNLQTIGVRRTANETSIRTFHVGFRMVHDKLLSLG
jgi:hypothetical protein